MWKLLAKWCAHNYINGGRTKALRNRRKVEVDTELSRVWDPEVSQSWGTKDLYTIELSKWLEEFDYRVSLDQLVDFIFSPREYVLRERDRRGAKRRRR